MQWGALRRMDGHAAELEPIVRGLVEQYPDIPVWRAGLAAVYAELGVAGQCDAIVTFNVRDFEPADRFGMRVLTPPQFLKEIRS